MIIEKWKNGTKQVDIAKDLKVTEAYVSQILAPEKKRKITKKPRFLNHTGSLEELVIMSIFAINSIKNKKEVKDKNVDSTYYQHYLSWIKWRKTFQKALGGEINENS